MHLLLADHLKLFRDALTIYLKSMVSDAEICGASNFDQALSLASTKDHLDIAVLSIDLPGMNGLGGLETFHDRASGTRTVILADEASPARVHEALERGAAGFLSKDLSGKVMLKALEIVMSGEKYMPASAFTEPKAPQEKPASSDRLIAIDVTGAQNSPLDTLTTRERQILSLVVLGQSNKEIAGRLSVKDITVSFHMKGLFRKLGATNRTQVATTALRLGWGN